MAIATKKLTYADYEKIPPDGFRHEIIEGEESMTPAPNLDHQTVVGNIFRIVANHVLSRKPGPKPRDCRKRARLTTCDPV